MKKEKTVKTHTRKLKSGKQVTVKQHTASYDAADVVADVLKKKGAGGELEQLKKKKAVKPEPVEKEDIYSEYGFTKDEFAEWYEGTGSKADKKVEKILRKAMGRKAYNELSDSAADNYKKGGANGFFKKSIKAMDSDERFIAKEKKRLAKNGIDIDSRLRGKKATEAKKDLIAKGFEAKKNSEGETILTNGKEAYRYVPAGGLIGGALLDKLVGSRLSRANKLAGGSSKTTGEDKPAKEPTKKSKLSLPTDGQFEALQKALDRKGYYVHRTSSGSLEVYKKGDRKALKNLKAAITYSEGPVSWGPNKDLEKSLGGVVNEALANGLKSSPKSGGTKEEYSKAYWEKKYPKPAGKDIEVMALMGLKKMRPTTFTKGAIREAARNLRKMGDTKKAAEVEALLEKQMGTKSSPKRKATTKPPKSPRFGETEESSIPPKKVPISGPKAAIQRRGRIERLEEESQLRRSIEKLTKSRDKHHRGSIGYGEINREIVALRRRLNKIKKY